MIEPIIKIILIIFLVIIILKTTKFIIKSVIIIILIMIIGSFFYSNLSFENLTDQFKQKVKEGIQEKVNESKEQIKEQMEESKEQINCKLKQGVWQTDQEGTDFCNLPTKDQNKTCIHSDECEEYCIAKNETTGYCQEYKYKQGCFEVLLNETEDKLKIVCIDQK